jgi:hypothetical protein
MIRAYPGRPSVQAGDTLTLHVSGDEPRFRIAIYRWEHGLVPMRPADRQRGGWLRAEHLPDGRADQDWQWPAYQVETGDDWPSGVYLAHLELPRGGELRLSSDCAAALFVVRARASKPILYKLPVATWHAYNCSGGGCFYTNPPRSAQPPGARVSFLRPGGGIGGATWGAPDHYDLRSPRQTFAHWDARFIRWLARSGYAADFCTDLDIHAQPSLLQDYRLLLSVGHDEYWTEDTRDAVEDFVAGGGNLALFGANLCWWRIHLVDDATAMVCHQGSKHGAWDHWWPAGGAGRPEDSLSGASYRHGGGWWDGPRETNGFIVQQPGHWIFTGTGLARGEAVGADTWPPLPGYECDGVPIDHIAPDGMATLSAWRDEAGTPDGYQLLAACPLDRRWQELPPRERHGAGEGIHVAAMGMFRHGGTVFSAGTTDWAQVLGEARDRKVERITRNVLDRLCRA